MDLKEPISLEVHRLARTLKRHLNFLIEGERALMAMPLSKARELFLLHVVQSRRDTLVQALPLLEKPQQDYLITLMCMKS